MTKPLSPIHAPLDPTNTNPVPAPPSRIALLAALDQRILSGTPRSLGAGGASSLFTAAIQKALVDEMAEQLREGPFESVESDSEVRKWAGEIIEAFSDEKEY